MIKKQLVSLLVFCLIFSFGVTPGSHAAETSIVHYIIDNDDLSTGLTNWETGDASKFAAQKHLTLKQGAALWRAIPITGNGNAPAAGDSVYAKATFILNGDVTTDANVLIRLNAGSTLAEINDLSGLQRGKEAESTTKFIDNNGVIPVGQNDLWIEIHNDTPGTIEIAKIVVWGEANGVVKNYATYDFSSGMAGWDNNGTDKSYLTSSLLMQPGAAAWRSVPFGDGSGEPQAGDKIQVKSDLFVEDGVNRTDGVFVRVHDAKGTQVDINDIANTPRGTWFTAQDSVRTNGGILHDDAVEIWVELHNETDKPVRIRNIGISAEREESISKYDVNGDNAVDAKDEEALTAMLRTGKPDLKYDYDADGQLTGKDLSFFRKYGLKRADEVYLNLKHFNFMNEKITIDGVPMFITHLYSEPVDRNDLSRGYEWVGDPQEGLGAVDDVSRSVIAYVEHYETYGDDYSYDMIKRGLEFLMWMQYDDGDFDNFVVRDADGTIHKKDSHSSQKSFSWWAVRAYEAMAKSLPQLKKTDRELEARVTARLNLSLKRLKEKTDPNYGQYYTFGDVKVAKWLLMGDVWVSSIAVNALTEHYHATNDASVKKSIRESLLKLGEGIYMARRGTSFRDFAYGGIMQHNGEMTNPDRWDEWGSIQVRALAFAGEITGQSQWIEAAEQAADAFLSDLLISGRAENLHPNKKPYPLINYGTASYVDNYLALYEVTGKRKYAVMAGLAGTWWTGNNVRSFSMFDQKNGYAYDGLYDTRVNINSGGESLAEALRALLRINENTVARSYLPGVTTNAHIAQTIEIENLYKGTAPADIEMTLPGGELNVPEKAVMKQDADSGSDEAKIYEDAMQVGADTLIYPNWKGQKTIFVAASGHNNIRLFDDGAIRTRIPLDGGQGGFKPGDSVRLQFNGRVEFDTGLRAEVAAINAAGEETIVADANDMSYHPRTWYAGESAVSTTPRAAIPEGTVELVVRFEVDADNPKPYEGYASIADAKIYKMTVPEVRYASPDSSGGAYVEMPAGQQKTFAVEVPKPGVYDIMLSSVAAGGDGAEPAVVIGVDDQAGKEFPLQNAPSGHVSLKRIATVSLTAGKHELHLKNPSQSFKANIDAIILYPIESGVVISTADGGQTQVVRDSVSGTLFVGTPADAAARDRISVNAVTNGVRGGQRVTVSGKVTNGAGKAVSNKMVTIAIANVSATGKTTDTGDFTVHLALPSSIEPGQHRVTAKTGTGEGTTWIFVNGTK
ncbi:hypothetical protein SD71_02190 [Cohnella kolymensis]|uniref:Uncharacterized protein n=1 Tax=Cohnella kolymensis TaxID=1590652 RepID=A0ABR5A8W2_9BACL|nr:carboxypeptidase-like regulatory domain-containing protein [Cohnella kolymensis]KIL37470.1 hypothetical protein SD71_02190 [Cohnella kolymensis]